MTASIASKIVLGTAQFQLGYGATGTAMPHATADALASEILAAIPELGIDMLDTAAAYGDSESLIGRYLPEETRIGIITKPPAWAERPDDQDPGEWMIEELRGSLRHLARKSVYGFLFHSPDAFEGSDRNRVIDALEAVKASGKARKVGVSIYTSAQIDRIMESWTPDLVQVPINIVDQRLMTGGSIERLSSAGVEIHARSVFLRGMLLLPVGRLPEHLAPLEPVLSDIDREAGGFSLIGRLSACLSAVGRVSGIGRILVGAESAEQLRQIYAAAVQADTRHNDMTRYAMDNPKILNPGLWPQN